MFTTLATLAGCGAPAEQPARPAGLPVSGATAVASPLPRAAVGTPAASTRLRFAPTALVLADGDRAEVRPARTVDGELQVPEQVRHVGWWDGSAYAGDPYGATVIAGHVDSRSEGIGFFARLLRARTGQRVTLHGGGHSATYRIVSVQSVAQAALATDSRAFDQRGDHRLVLITCTGTYDRARGGYTDNLVVTAAPVGRVR